MSKFVIEGGHPITGSIRPAGNKNEALPAVMACLLTDQPVILHRVPRIGDVSTVVAILKGLGVEVEWQGEETLYLCAKDVSSYKPDGALCSSVRASILLLGPLLARFGQVRLHLPGGDVIGARRLDAHFDGLKCLGGQLFYGNPIVGKIDRKQGNEVYLDEPSVTATENILLLSVLCQGLTTIHNAACEPHVAGLCRLLNSMGAKISGVGSNVLTVKGVASLGGASHEIGPDFMEAGSYLCLGAIGKGKVTIEDVNPGDLKFVLKTLARLGVKPKVEKSSLVVEGSETLTMEKDLAGGIASIYSGPWPAFSTDLMSVAIVTATQAKGHMVFHEKMFEGRMFFTDKLMSMGADIVLCDPHRVVVVGGANLTAAHMSSPDVRAGMALLMAAAVASGTSKIDNIYQIERGYSGVEEKFSRLGIRISKEVN